MSNIYLNPYKYAVECNVPIDLAKIACKKYRHIHKEQKKHIPRCPNCGSKRLGIEHGSYEEGYSSFVVCDNCGCDFDFSEVENIDYLPYCTGDDFDAVLYFASYKNKEEGWLEACGAETLEEWHRFARDMIIGRRM